MLSYAESHREAMPQDFVKLLFQSAFGGEHMIEDFGKTLARIEREAENLTEEQKAQPYFEKLPGNYVRFNLSVLDIISAETLNRIFIESAGERDEDAEKKFAEGLQTLSRVLEKRPGFFSVQKGAGELPLQLHPKPREVKKRPGFSKESFEEFLSLYWKNGGGAVSHSEKFRKAYSPAYRVVRREYIPLLPVLERIEKLLKNRQRVLISIDGRCGSGKTGMAKRLGIIYGANVFHADDFYLPSELRTEERLSEPGGNMHRERLLREVILPAKRGERILYRPFDCKVMDFSQAEVYAPKKLTIIEGSYSQHPDLREFYDLCVFSDVSKEEQMRRLKLRESRENLKNFEVRWIPMEERYFEALDVRKNADLLILNEI